MMFLVMSVGRRECLLGSGLKKLSEGCENERFDSCFTFGSESSLV